MKLLHLSDLHLGKRFNKFSLLEDQRYILKQILTITDEKNPDCVMIAGDVYDKTVPSAEAVALFDGFLTSLAERSIPVFIISGNHDSPERIAFGEKIMKKSNIFISPVYNGSVTPVTLYDSFGEVRFYMLPFVRPANIRPFFPEKQIDGYTSAVSVAIEAMHVDLTVRNVMIAHQFVTGAEQSGSEEIYAGSLENIDAGVFSVFDYTALGHLHGPQNVSSERIRYCGTPLKYSFAEVHHHKSVTIAELGEKGTLPKIETVRLVPLIDMQELRGTFLEMMDMDSSDSYTHVTLTDEEMIPNAMARLRQRFPNIMTLDYDNEYKNTVINFSDGNATEQQTPFELFSEFFSVFNGRDMNEEQQTFVSNLITEIWEGEQ